MKISKITIKQLFGIKEWQGDGKNIELVGDNGTGKTSVIDAIRYALTNSSDREFIVKNGETEGEIYIETDNGLSIDRKARTAMTDYKSVKQNGNVIPSPESFLKTIFTPLQLSPMEFISMDKKTQNATILDMIQYDWNLDTIKEWFGEIPRDVNYEQNILAVLNDIQAENGYYFMHRQDVNRDIRAKKAVIADIGSSLPIDYDGERWEKENLSDLYTEIEKIRKNNETIEKATLTAPAKSSYNQSGHYYGVQIIATDEAGNSTSVNQSDATLGSKLRLTVKEKTAPVITISAPTASQLLTSNQPTITFTVTDDDSGVNPDTIKLLIDGSEISGVTKTKTSSGYSCSYKPTAALADGAHTVVVKATDYDGNAATQKSVSFKIDTVPPELSVTSPVDKLITNKTTVTVSGTTNDATSSPVTLTINGSAVTVYDDGTFSKDITLKDGSNTITIVAKDGAGRTTTVKRTVTLDTKAPVISDVSLAPNPADVGATYVISVSVTD